MAEKKQSKVGAGRRTSGRKAPLPKRGKSSNSRSSTEAEAAPKRQPLPALVEPLSAYLAAPGLEDELQRELGHVVHRHGRLLLAEGKPRPSIWSQDVWLDSKIARVESIGGAAKILRGIQRNWAGYSHHDHRRMTLLSDRLPPIKERARPFPCKLPDAALGAYTLLDRHTLLYSPTCRSPFPNGEVHFVADLNPPSRAYRKLWEVFTLCQVMPQRGDRCIDMGATPGGWTWVLAQLGANVRSVDKAPLHPDVSELPNVKAQLESAFGIDPRLVTDPYDWFFSDVICYPKRLLAMVQRWLDAGAAKRFVCTLKFQGETDHETVEAFAKIPGSRLMHLHHNRHELTWVKLDSK
ncbi:MAG: 23S rRNA (cytidine2498-2'-O)-methyltransferase [Myxococcota bacterium]|jgi:23S rRNA (cytidine2498-2'-O)-methyltransferase